MTLFADKAAIVQELRSDRLVVVSQTYFPDVELSDDYIYKKLLAAEAQLSRILRVHFEPTEIIPSGYEQSEIDELPEGTAWEEEPPYDYDPDFFMGERWGYIVTRQNPVLEVKYIKFSYPAPTNAIYEIPLSWVRLDKRYGHIRLVPASQAFTMPLGAFLMQALGGGRTIPHMIRVRYTTGLGRTAEEVAQKWPDLIDAIKKQAVVNLVKDAFLPSSGSISADGLDQSMSVDASHYQEQVDHMLFGPKGSNGGLQAAIHGIRSMVLA